MQNLPNRLNLNATTVVAAILSMTLSVFTIAGEPWAPFGGYSSVNQEKTYNFFYFTEVEGVYRTDQTYEHETQVYNPDFADYDGYWSSNLPSAYYDTTFLDDSDIDNFTIGSSQGSDLRSDLQYYTYMQLRKGNDSDCTGCCSSHGGVVCNNGVTLCADGTALSPACEAKGCNKCLDVATVRIKGQIGHRVPEFCHSTWCIFAEATTGTMCLLCLLNAPQYNAWTY